LDSNGSVEDECAGESGGDGEETGDGNGDRMVGETTGGGNGDRVVAADKKDMAGPKASAIPGASKMAPAKNGRREEEIRRWMNLLSSIIFSSLLLEIEQKWRHNVRADGSNGTESIYLWDL
jgi:hypothetical protein